ncbi:MAG: helix-turn-helix transcriptional regulator [Dehalococcoidia bacterium]|nr:helix-turn-helix transcriptional regulator [Dehalococcoidia bacterium]
MSVQIIEKDGKPEWAIVPYNVYAQLLADAEILQDIQDYEAAKRGIEEGEELVPSQLTYAILDGQNPIKVWREHRRLTQQQLADLAGISKAYLSQIETGKRTGSTEVVASIAKALHLSLDDIVPSPTRPAK